MPDARALHELLSHSALPALASGVERYRDRVLAWVADGVFATTIFAALRCEGFAGSYSAVRRVVQKLPRALNPTVPLDFAPGHSAQVDFGAGPTLIENGRRIKTWVFVMVSFSRLLYAELSPRLICRSGWRSFAIGVGRACGRCCGNRCALHDAKGVIDRGSVFFRSQCSR